jgi:hypothetical protein
VCGRFIVSSLDDAAPALLDHHRRHPAGHLIGGDVIGLDDRADDIVRHRQNF